jgi:mannosyltransferase
VIGAQGTLRRFARNNETALWLSIICIIAIYLRFRGLSFQSYWFDELFSAYFSNPAHSFRQVVQLTISDVHPPLFQLAMWWSYQLFGYTDWAGRLPSAIAGAATIPTIYLLGRDIFNSRTGLYAAALATPNYYLIYYAQEARSYALLYFFCTLSFLFFIRARTSASRLNVLLYICSTLALLYTQYFGLVLLAAESLVLIAFFLVTGRPDASLIKRAVISAGAIFVGMLPLIPVILKHSVIGGFWIPQPEPGFLADYLTAYFHSGIIAVVIVGLAVFALIFPRSPAKTGQAYFGLFALFAWLVLGYLIPWLRGLIGQPILTDRNTIMVVPPLILLAAYGLASLPRLWLQRAVGAAVLAYSFYLLFFSLEYFDRVSKNQYREITQAMNAYEPTLPVYTLPFNANKYNVYFEQQNSSLVAQEIDELSTLLQDDASPPLFWLAGGHVFSPQATVGEQYGMVEVGRYRFKGTAAALLLNPAMATRLTLNVSDARTADDRAVFTSAPSAIDAGDLLLLATTAPSGQAEFREPIDIELFTEDSRTLRRATLLAGAAPAILTLGRNQGPVSATITVAAGVTPELWLVDSRAETH